MVLLLALLSFADPGVQQPPPVGWVVDRAAATLHLSGDDEPRLDLTAAYRRIGTGWSMVQLVGNLAAERERHAKAIGGVTKGPAHARVARAAAPVAPESRQQPLFTRVAT